MRHFHHPNLLQLHDVGKPKRYPFLGHLTARLEMFQVLLVEAGGELYILMEPGPQWKAVVTTIDQAVDNG